MNMEEKSARTLNQEIELAKMKNDNDLARAERKAQTIVAICLAVIMIVIIIGEIVLELNKKHIPEGFATLKILLAGSLVGFVGFHAGRSSK